MTSPDRTVPLPPVAGEVVAGAVEGLTARLLKKLDGAIERYAAVPATTAAPDGGDDGGISVRCGEDAVVTLSPARPARSPTLTRRTAPACWRRAVCTGRPSSGRARWPTRKARPNRPPKP